MPENIYFKNTLDWPKEVQPSIDTLCALDGNGDSLTEEDLQIAGSKYCGSSTNDSTEQKIKEILGCPAEKVNPLWSKAAADKLLSLRHQFSSDNPIHELIKLEEEMTGREKAEEAYLILNQILKEVKDRLIKDKDLSPQGKLKLVYDVMEGLGISLKGQEDTLFVGNITRKVLDCDTSSFVVAAVAHEFGWPVHLVDLPRHTFIRWVGVEQFNIDAGIIWSDSYYWFIFGVDIVKGTPFKEAKYSFYFNRGVAKSDLGRYEDAIKDYDEAIRLNPNYAVAYYNRGNAKAGLGKYEDAIKDYDEAIRLKPDYAEAYNNRGVAKDKLGRYEDAIKDYDEAIRLDPNLAEAYYNRGNAKSGLGRHEDAIKDYDEAIRLKPNYAVAYSNRGVAKTNLGRYEDAIRDFNKALELDPNLFQTKFNLLAVSLIPDPFYAIVQPRIGMGGHDDRDIRTAVGAYWPVIYLGEGIKVGTQFELGVGANGQSSLMDLSAGIMLSYSGERASVGALAGAGYNFPVSGDPARSPIGSGASFHYGLQFNHAISQSLGIGLRLAIQHRMDDPSKTAFLPGAMLTYTLWN